MPEDGEYVALEASPTIAYETRLEDFERIESYSRTIIDVDSLE